ncbi:MAG: hypothetical protein V1709_06195 [Planctomycetota bacterium]
MELEIPCFVQSTGGNMAYNVDCSLSVDTGANSQGLLIPCSITTTIVSIVIVGGGTGYVVGDTVTIVQGGNTTATATVTSIGGGGAITGISILDGGSDYSDGAATITGGSGNDDATVTITVSSVTTDLIDAVTMSGAYANIQSIRLSVTVGGVNVTGSLVGTVQVSHNLNYISSFSFSLNNTSLSPLNNANIESGAIVVITSYVNGQEIKMMTGLVDNIKVTYTGGYRINIAGRDYGKKLLKKTMTLISVDQAANNQTRGSIVEYLAEQAEVTDLDVPTGDSVGIDHSFQDQTIWDMIQKECVIEGWNVRFDENGRMFCKIKALKSSADWTYGENKFTELGLMSTDEYIINKVIILGAIFENVEITQSGEDSGGVLWTASVEGRDVTYDYTTTTVSNSYPAGTLTLTGWTSGDFTVNVEFLGYYLGFTYQQWKFTLSYSGSETIEKITWISNCNMVSSGYGYTCTINRAYNNYSGEAVTISASVKTRTQTGGGVEELEEDNPEETFTETVTYEQVKATVTDPNSIAEYGERKPNNEGTLNFPLAETEAQCKRIGENIIKDSHRWIEQPDFRVPFNPKLIVGHTVQLTDTKIGYNADKYLVEEVVHYIEIKNDGVKARTRIGCVFYT